MQNSNTNHTNTASNPSSVNISSLQTLSQPIFLPTPTLSRVNTAPSSTISPLQQSHLAGQQLIQTLQDQLQTHSVSANSTPFPLHLNASQFPNTAVNTSNFSPLAYSSTFQSLVRLPNFSGFSSNPTLLDPSQFSILPLHQNFYSPPQQSIVRTTGNTIFASPLQPQPQLNHLQQLELALESPTPLFLSPTTNNINAGNTRSSTLPNRVSSASAFSSAAQSRSFKPYSTATLQSSVTVSPYTKTESALKRETDGIQSTNPSVKSDSSVDDIKDDIISRRINPEDSANIRRKKHKEVEIRRRKKINALFSRLSEELDCGPTDKASILAAALAFIQRAKQSGIVVSSSRPPERMDTSSSSPSNPLPDFKSD